MHFTSFMSTLLFPDAFLPRNHEHFMNWKTEKRHFEERAAPWAGLETWSAIAVDQKHSFKNEAWWTQLVNAFWKKSADACLFDTLFRTLGRLEPKWIVKRENGLTQKLLRKAQPKTGTNWAVSWIFFFWVRYVQQIWPRACTTSQQI